LASALEVIQGGDDVVVGPVAAAAVVVLVVEELPAQIDQGVGAPVGSTGRSRLSTAWARGSRMLLTCPGIAYSALVFA
jgi:hypothetical protein